MRPVVTEVPYSAGHSHRFAARFLLLVIITAWFLALAIGSLVYDGEPIRVKPHQLPLRQVDWVFRRVGGILLFLAWGIRAITTKLFHIRGDIKTEHIWIPAGLYALQAAVRSIIYYLHSMGWILSNPFKWATPFVLHDSEHPPHIMSDHILLASTVVGGLGVEAVVLYLSITHRRQKAAAPILKALSIVATLMALLISAESYYTARYFHPPSEIVAGAVLGFVLFQAPLLMFAIGLLRSHEENEAKILKNRRGRAVLRNGSLQVTAGPAVGT